MRRWGWAREGITMWMRAGLMIVAVVGFVGCGSPEPRYSAEAHAASQEEKSREEEGRAEGDRAADATAELAGTTYSDQRGTGACTSDCGGHNAGWAWAEENGITDPGECGGNSQSFIEGCEAYAEDVQAIM